MEIADVRRQVEMSGPADQRELPLCRAALAALYHDTPRNEHGDCSWVGIEDCGEQDGRKIKSARRSEMDHDGITVTGHFSLAAIERVCCPSVSIAGSVQDESAQWSTQADAVAGSRQAKWVQ